MAFQEHWKGNQVILVILAHPDDPEFFCGATIARWSAAGHEIHYLLFTKGDKGTNDPEMTPEKLMEIREKEQREAASVLGVKTISYLDKKDGYITADLDTRKEIVRYVRKVKPSVVVTCDPANIFTRDGHINHPDHRYVGQQVIDAVFPATGNRLFFPELLDEGLKPHTIHELWLSIPDEFNIVIDVSETWPLKLLALSKHASQVGDGKSLLERMSKRNNVNNPNGKLIYEERFKRIVFK
jgi:LmbE family N-acetylglucosaminyl deacetylase